MIELIVYPKGQIPRLINPSPFCAKTEIFLRMYDLEFKINEFNGNPSKFPNGKLPVIKYNNKITEDSTIIQNLLINDFKLKIDVQLSSEEKAIGFFMSKMLEEYFYWSLLHERWFIDSNWQKLRDDYFRHIPSLIRPMITHLVRKQTLKSSIGHGMSRHSDERVLDMGKECLRYLSDYLSDKTFFFGDIPSLYDVTAYAFVSSVLHSPLGPVLATEARKYNNLVAYDEAIYKQIFKELSP